MTRPPCKDCEARRVGCHDPAACPKWAAYLAKLETDNAARPSREELYMMSEYVVARSRRAPFRDRRRRR